MTYEEFIKSKQHSISNYGFSVENLNESLFPFQKFIVKKALEMGKYAIFADCGLGKTIMQLEWANQVSIFTQMPVLILAPLAVSSQTILEGVKFGIHVDKLGSGNIQITNYEQIDNIDFSLYSGIILDESSILKNFTGSIRNKIIDLASNVRYKLACTATPSPNDPMELGNHAEFLNVMTRNEMLSMFFVHDGGETSKWRLKKHAIDTFYDWVGKWAVMLNKPTDIGFEMTGYNLPDINYIEYEIKTPKKDNGLLFNSSVVSATNFNKELRNTINERLQKVANIVNNSDQNFIIWIKQNEEGKILRQLIPGSIEVKGSDSSEMKEKRLLGFARNEFRVLITKSKIAQFGLNYQNCQNQVFASLDFSFESLYQSIRRSYRFGQKSEVNIHIIKTDTMKNVVQSIERKQKLFKEMQDKMSLATNRNVHLKNEKKIYSDPEKIETDNYEIYRGDCVKLIKNIKSNSIGFSVFSPPFADLYTYSNNQADMGNSKDYKEFLNHFDFLVKELYRVVKAGRNVAVHCMDLPIQKGKEGFIGLRDFSGMILESFSKYGFIYHSRITIWKNPVTEMQRTKALGLLHKQVKKDSTMSRVGIPDYVLVFRKDGERKDPVKNVDISVDLWQKYASPVWMDIDYGKTLNGYRNGRDSKDEKHICPLQLPTIERLIHLYTNKGDTVLTPFMGIGSEVYQSIKMDRKAIGFELKQSYFKEAVKNIKSIQKQKMQTSLF